MLDAGGGGGYGGTNWSAASVTDMWLAVANQDTTPHWQLLSGWRKSYELTLQHMAQVKNYRENLATAWPPEKSPAAAAYIARLDVLIDYLQQTYDAAVANHSAFSNATSAISSARTKLEKVVNEYLANEGKLETFAQEQAERPKGGLQRGPEPKPPVADGRQVQLEAQARSIMYGLSTEVSQARTQITKPKLYDPAEYRTEEKDDRLGGGYTPPMVPPVVPFDPAVDGSKAVPLSNSVAANVQPNPIQPLARVPGLILGGVEPPIATPPPLATAPNLPVNPGPPPPNVIPPPAPIPGVKGPTVHVTPTPGIGRGTTADGLTRPSVGPPVGGIRAMPPGGLIGGIPGGLGQPSAGSRPTHVNPVGGVISPNNTQARSGQTGRGVVTPPQTIPSASGRSQTLSQDSEKNNRWDPDNPWEITEGVSPVVSPALPQPVDPGPAIGLR
jgi:hypothetical protein